MVSAVRRGTSMRQVARQHGVSLRTVQHWVLRAGNQRLDRVDWSNHAPGAHQSAARTARPLEERIVQLRSELKIGVLGEYGAAAIRRALAAELEAEGVSPLPCERTIHRV